MAASDEPKGFRVSDRRSFAGNNDAPAADQTAPVPAKPAPIQAPPAAAAREDVALPPVDFHTFLLSLASSALLHLGELDDPGTGQSAPDLPMAQHAIDVIAMIQDKTRGNLTPPESKLLEGLLYDLRLRYVEAVNARPK